MTSDENAETEETEDGRGLLTTARDHPDATTRPIHTRPAETIALENGKTATPAGEMIGNGIETAVIADAETTMTGLRDAKGTETCLMVADLDGNGETAIVIANVSVTVTMSVSGKGETGEGPRLLRPGRGKLHLT